MTRAECAALDAADPLRARRNLFDLPDGVIYLDGNSLGPPPRATAPRIDSVIRAEWGRDLIASWNTHDWIGLPRRIGAKIAALVGAGPDEIIAADTVSINVFKLVAAALRLRPGRRAIVSERSNFPTDLYVVEGLLDLIGGHALVLVDDDAGIETALTEDTALLMLTEVDYRSGRLLDMAALTARAHAVGALTLWDLSHSAGALEIDLRGAGADFAVGGTYKYLNGGPGGTAWLYVAEQWRAAARQPLSGWMGHRAPFDFDHAYAPADGMTRHLCGTPPVLSLAAAEPGLDTFAGLSMAAVRAKSVALTDLFIRLVDGFAAELGLTLATPRAPARRGSQVSWRHADGYAVMRAMIRRGVVGDFRAPDILRFGFAPLYVRFVDVWDASATLGDVLRTEAWRAETVARAMVT